MISQKEIIEDVKLVINQLDRIPSLREYDKLGKFNHGTIINIFGKWNDFLIKNFGQLYSRPMTIRLCLACKKETKNPKFCSQSCAATYNNKIFPKRQKAYHDKMEFLCPNCKTRLMVRDSKMCRRCTSEKFLNEFGDKTIAEFKSRYARHKYQSIRIHAKRLAKFHDLKKNCKKCGYDTHVDLCHKKQISSFPKNTKISIVNSIDNLVYLCKNHHWELDNGYLTLD